MDFYSKDEYTMEDIEQLIKNEVEENIHLDYKAAGSLEKADKKRLEITKDVSAFANSDGGIIIYGLSEEEHKPKDLSPIDGNTYTKEWLESVIQRIQPRIEGVIILPIRNGDILKTAYIVKIPKSDFAPHMAIDNRYYKRYNFSSVPMEDYEVRELYNRVSTPKLEILGCNLHKCEETENSVIYDLWAKIGNYGHKACESYKLNFYINRLCCEIRSNFIGRPISYTQISSCRLKLSSPSSEVIYPSEELDLGHFEISVKKNDIEKFTKSLVIDMILYYPGGSNRLAYSFDAKKYIEDDCEIETLLDTLDK